MIQNSVPKLITFDGEARSGKGTIVQATKDYLRDEKNYKVMLIDAGQVFRVLVVAATKDGVSMEDPAAIDRFLSDNEKAEQCVQLVKDVYHMEKDVRDALLYTNEVGANSAKIGARPLSQSFKDELLKKWLRDAAVEGYEVVLLDGRALEEAGTMLEREELCEFILGLYFICDPIMGARRTLGYAATPYDELSAHEKEDVDNLVKQITSRNDADRTRTVQPIIQPLGEVIQLPEVNFDVVAHSKRPMLAIDTSAKMTKQSMALPVCELVTAALTHHI